VVRGFGVWDRGPREAIEAAGHRAVIKPKPLQRAVKDGFTIDDFTVDEQAAAVT
jgi:hypothetical protein